MRHVVTLFDKSRNHPRPLSSVVVEDGRVEFIDAYLPGTGLRLKQVRNGVQRVRELLEDGALCNDCVTHLLGFGLELHGGHGLVESCVPVAAGRARDAASVRKSLLRAAVESVRSVREDPWRVLMGRASVMYAILQQRGVMHGYRRVDGIHYDLGTYTGRSRTTGFNVQGMTGETAVRHVRDDYDWFVCLDWTAADVRMAAFMSGDGPMAAAFSRGDPYSVIAECLGEPSREQCKRDFFRSFYSLRTDDPVFQPFPEFRKWMADRVARMRSEGFVETILGRRYGVGGENGRNELSVFNAQFQGSVAHAMHSVMARLLRRCPQNVLTEVHDSVVLCAPENSIGELLPSLQEIVARPLEGVGGLMMPLRVSVGRRWRGWKLLRSVP